MSQDVGTPTRKPRPVLGPALILFGAVTWAFVVLGTYTTSWFSGSAPLGEGFAVLGVALVTVCAWIFAVRRSRPDSTRVATRSVAVGLAGLGLWVLCVILATVFGRAFPGAIIESTLLVVAAAATFVGHRWTTPPGRPAIVTPGKRAAVAAMWIGVAMVTLGACVEMVGAG